MHAPYRHGGIPAIPVATLRVLTGPYAGQTVDSRQLTTEGVDPVDLLVDLAQLGATWDVCYAPHLAGTLATGTAERWALADLVGRIVRAGLDGRPVRVLGRVYSPPRGEDLAGWLGELEDLIACSGRSFAIVRDDDQGGLVIGAVALG